MISYENFAKFYDTLMSDVDYHARAEYLLKVLKRYGREPGLTLDLACGTGSLSIELAKAGCEVIGVDRSPQMLSVAAGKAGSTNKSILFLCQDITQLDLYGTVDTVVSSLDCLNHLAGTQMLQKAFDRISLFLNPGGLFLFDLNTPYKFQNILGDQTFIYDEPSVYCVWQNNYREKSRVCHFDLTFFERSGDLYRRCEEHFSEYAYSTRTIKRLLGNSGFILRDIFDDLTFDSPSEKSERILYAAGKE